jgi:hypothetical protein
MCVTAGLIYLPTGIGSDPTTGGFSAVNRGFFREDTVHWKPGLPGKKM